MTIGTRVVTIKNYHLLFKSKKRDALASLLVKTFIYLKIPKLLIGNTAIRYCY